MTLAYRIGRAAPKVLLLVVAGGIVVTTTAAAWGCVAYAVWSSR